MPLLSGHKLGPYEILAPIGAGGMGEAYRARDGRLDREVALKILPADVANVQSRYEIWGVDAAPYGSVYGCVTDLPAELVSRSLDSDQTETLARFPQVSDPDMIVVLPDGRVVLTVLYPDRPRLVVAQAGKAPVSMVATTEETSTPATLAGPRELAFLIGPAPRGAIAFADINMRLFRVPLDGSPETEILADAAHQPRYSHLSPGSWNADGRLLISLHESWFAGPAMLDTRSGRVQPLPADPNLEYLSMAWLPDGRIMALRMGNRSTLSRFAPEREHAR